jgi:hypothetical protein
MPGFMPGIHVFLRAAFDKQDVDGRTEPAMTVRKPAPLFFVMPALVAGIHVFLYGTSAKQEVDGRDKRTAVRFNFSGQGA